MQNILTEDFGMRKIATKMVSRIFTDEQKHRQLHVSCDILNNAELFERVTTDKETLCFQNNPEAKR